MNVVCVAWIDSRGVADRWQMLSEFDPQHICHCYTWGVLVREDDDELHVAQSLGREDDGDHQVTGIMTIPRMCVKSVEILGSIESVERSGGAVTQEIKQKQ